MIAKPVTQTVETVEAKVAAEARKAVEVPEEGRRHISKMHWHLFCILLSASVIYILMVTGMDKNPLGFSFGPVMPQVVMEVIDRIRKL